MKKTLNIGFLDTFDTAKNFFIEVLGIRYNVIVSDYPDYLFFGDANFGRSNESLQMKCKRIFYTGENVRPDKSVYNFDYALTFDFINSSTHYRLPLYVLEMHSLKNEGIVDTYDWIVKERQNTDWEEEWYMKTQFCSFVQSNPNNSIRNTIFHEINRFQKVDSGGPLFNNIGYVLPREGGHKVKHEFISNYRFNIAVENGFYPGYVTEKLLNAYYAKTIPIYFGSSVIERDFNPRSMINIKEYSRIDDPIKEILDINSNKNKWCDIVSQPPMINNRYVYIENFLQWFDTFVYSEEIDNGEIIIRSS